MAEADWKAFVDFVDNKDNVTHFIERLRGAVEIESVSGDNTLPGRGKVVDMAHFLNEELASFGVETELVSLGPQVDDDELQLPPVIVGRIGADPSKKTVLVYGHYDVQPAARSDGWDYEPFELTEVDDLLYGRGSTDDKGPVLCWVNVLEAFHTLGIPFPVNIRFCFEGMEESGSQGLGDFITSEVKKGNNGWFDHIDCVCISDNYWLNNRTPALTYGLRGIVYYGITICGPKKDLHSGEFGGMVYEPMTDLFAVMSQLVDTNGKIKIPGLQVDPPDDEERKLYEKLDYSVDDLKDAVGGVDIGLSDDKVTLLMGRMREPCLSIHGVQGGSSDDSSKTVIPRSVTGKFSLRIVPPQAPTDVDCKVREYVNQKFKDLYSKNTMDIKMIGEAGEAWEDDHNHWNYKAADRATQRIYKMPPDYTREGGSIGVVLTIANALGVNILLLPIGRGDDGAHSTDEKINKSNFIQGTKLQGTYLYELAKGK